MAKVDLGAIAERLFGGFLAPLVVGGPLEPGRPIGGRAALALGIDRRPIDIDRLAHTELARVRVARRLIAVDRFEGPTAFEWALGACLHDLVQTTHPDLAGVFRAKAPSLLLANVDATLDRIPPPVTAHEALSRHTWFARLFEIARTDTRVSWWSGSQTFLGTEPPARLQAWPGLRRVHVDHAPRPFVELVESGAGARVPRDAFLAAVQKLLTRTPLTDLATAGRAEPRFAWTAETLSLAATRAGRTLALRALAPQPEEAVSAGLGRATEALFGAGAWSAAVVAMDLLGERALAAAEAAPESGLSTRGSEAAAFARAAGALVAARHLDAPDSPFSKAERARLRGVLSPWRESEVARRIGQTVGQIRGPGTRAAG